MPDKRININDIESIGSASSVTDREVVKCLEENLRDYQQVRQVMETYWRDYYISYMTTPMAKRQNLTRISAHIGDVQTNWRHNIKTPKAYEITETIVSYFKGAFFPNDRWFDFTPSMPVKNPNYHAIIDINRRFVNKKLVDAQFKTNFGIFLREMVIAGTSALMFPWVEDNAKFQVLSPFEFLLDPEAQDPNEANFIRSYSMSPVRFRQHVEDETFNLVDSAQLRDILDGQTYATPHQAGFDIDRNALDSLRSLMGMSDFTRHSNKSVTVFEFWGELELNNVVLKNVRASWTESGTLLNLETNPYGHKPFMIGTYLRLSSSPYGIGALQPISSQLYYKDTLTSRNADNVAVSSDTMMEVVMDGVIDPDDVYIAPGKKIFVTQSGSVNPINLPYAGGATMQDLQVLEQTADKAIGTGPYIGVGNGRAGERVTAAEVQAQQQTGDNRLTDVFVDLEAQVMLPFIKVFHQYCQKYSQGGVLAMGDVYIQVNPGILQFPFDVISLGANHVADKEYNLRQMMDWLGIVAQNQQMAQMVNWAAVTQKLTYMMLPQLADEVMQQQEQTPAMPQGGGPMEQAMGQMSEAANFVGGEAAQGALMSQEMAGQLPAAAEQLVQGLQNNGTAAG